MYAKVGAIMVSHINCIPLYFDFASIFFGLYEMDKRFQQYALIVGYVVGDKLTILSSLPALITNGKEAGNHDHEEWLAQNAPDELIRNKAIVQYKPKAIIFEHVSWTKPPCENHHRIESIKQIACKHVDLSGYVCEEPAILSKKGDCFCLAFRNRLQNNTYSFVREAYIMTCIKWTGYFDNGYGDNIFPGGNITTIVEKTIQAYDQGFRAVNAIPIITRISSLYYEKGKSKGKIAYVKPEMIRGNYVPITPIPFTLDHIKLLRKMLETTRDGYALLINEKEVFGIGAVKDDALFSFAITGMLEWEISFYGRGSVVRYKQGNYYVPLTYELKDWYIPYKTKNVGNLNKEKFTKFLPSLIDDLRTLGHGALVIITDAAAPEVARLCSLEMGIAINQDVLRQETRSITLQMEVTEDENICKLTKENVDLTNALSCIDGAIFMDLDGGFHGIGMILDGDAKVPGTPARGSRYNSAKTYVSRRTAEQEQVYALVFSDDGYIDIISSFDDDIRVLLNEKDDVDA